jgi:hypothetical protein
MSNKIYIDRFDYDYPYGSWGETFETKEDFKRHSLQHFKISKEYTFTGDLFSYNGVDYPLWIASDMEADRCKYILTTKVDFDGETLEDDITNDVCPYKFVLDEDKEVSYTDTTRDRYILVKQIITEGCCVGENCESLITIDYLNELSNDGCVSVTGTPLSGCCEFEGSDDKWSPSAGFFNAGHTNHYPIRALNSDPSKDENGYSFSPNVSASGNCCLNGLSQQQLFFSRIPRKNEVTFGYTEPYSYAQNITKSPTCSDPTFIYTGHRKFTRHTVQCNGEGVLDTGNTIDGIGYIVEGAFEKVCSVNGNTIKISFSPSSFTQNGDTQSCNVVINTQESTFEITGACEMTNALASGCTEEKISTTGISAPDGYEYTFGVDYPNPIPCAGGTISFYGDNSKCDGDVVNIPVSRVVPYNSGGETKYIVDESFSVEWDGGGCSIPIYLEINWETCGFHPDIEPEYDCSSYWYTEQWGDPENQYYHPNSNYDDYKI